MLHRTQECVRRKCDEQVRRVSVCACVYLSLIAPDSFLSLLELLVSLLSGSLQFPLHLLLFSPFQQENIYTCSTEQRHCYMLPLAIHHSTHLLQPLPSTRYLLYIHGDVQHAPRTRSFTLHEPARQLPGCRVSMTTCAKRHSKVCN